MEIGMIGLGRMGGNMVQRLLNGGHRVVTYDRSAEAVTASQAQGAVASASL
jgi:6-phosphogluconate dehydrogenase